MAPNAVSFRTCIAFACRIPSIGFWEIRRRYPKDNMILQVSQKEHIYALIVVKTQGPINADRAQTNSMAMRLSMRRLRGVFNLSNSPTRFTKLFLRPLASNNHLHMTCRLTVGFKLPDKGKSALWQHSSVSFCPSSAN